MGEVAGGCSLRHSRPTIATFYNCLHPSEQLKSRLFFFCLLFRLPHGPASHGRADHGGPVAVTMAIFLEQDPHVQIRAEASMRSRNRRTAVLTRPHRCSPS
ncbi:hypothetical protein FCV25MIE_10022 [Fagus crenata]